MNNNITRKIILNKIELMCSIGVHEFEKKQKQKINIDLEILLSPFNEPLNDSIEETLNYDEVRNIVFEIVNSRHFELQETLARMIFNKISSMDFVSSLSVKTSKPDVYNDVKEVAYLISNINWEIIL